MLTIRGIGDIDQYGRGNELIYMPTTGHIGCVLKIVYSPSLLLLLVLVIKDNQV